MKPLTATACAHCAKPFHGVLVSNEQQDLYAVGLVGGWTTVTVGVCLLPLCSKACALDVLRQLNIRPTPELTRPPP